jgi:hypothetical protein
MELSESLQVYNSFIRGQCFCQYYRKWAGKWNQNTVWSEQHVHRTCYMAGPALKFLNFIKISKERHASKWVTPVESKR